MCRQMLALQVAFRKTGRYAVAADFCRDLYASSAAMTGYVLSLALTHVLWPNHYAIYDFFLRQLEALPPVRRYLEIGPGHGLYLAAAMRRLSGAQFTAVDISPASIEITRSMVEHFVPAVRCNFQVRDAMQLPDDRWDCIVMCEVIEHVQNAPALLRTLAGLLAPDGRAFITTCATVPPWITSTSTKASTISAASFPRPACTWSRNAPCRSKTD